MMIKQQGVVSWMVHDCQDGSASPFKWTVWSGDYDDVLETGRCATEQQASAAIVDAISNYVREVVR